MTFAVMKIIHYIINVKIFFTLGEEELRGGDGREMSATEYSS